MSFWQMRRWSPFWLRRSYSGAVVRRKQDSTLPWLSSTKKRPRTCSRRSDPYNTWSRPFSSDTNTNPGKCRITYITDVEGDASYLQRYVQQSRVIRFVPVQPRWQGHASLSDSTSFPGDFVSCRYFPYDHCIDFQQHDNDDKNSDGRLIFGGDIWDKGGSDLYVIRQLLDLKRRYPTRVHFLMGNRDLNKMRICQELGIDDTLPPHDGFYWLRNFPRAKGDDDESSWIPSRTCASERLQFLLAKTMGSPKAFELRRLELQRERESAARAQEACGATAVTQAASTVISISDDDVVQSYRQSCHPITGEMGNFLANANLALRIGQLLVVHGALPLTSEVLQRALDAEEAQGEDATKNFWKDMSFAMPWTTEKKAPATPPSPEYNNISTRRAINDWIDELNAFAKQSIEQWKDSVSTCSKPDSAIANSSKPSPSESSIWATKGGYSSEFPAYQLTQFGMGWTPDGKRNPTVVYSSWSVDGMPTRFFPNISNDDDRMFVKLVREFFRQSGIKLILAGHQPQGDTPWPIRIDLQSKSSGNDGSTVTNEHLGWVVCCDTSYSGDTVWVNRPCAPKSSWRNNKGRGEGPGFRGDVAVSETLVETNGTGRIADVRWHGVLSDGTAYETSNIWNVDNDAKRSCASTVGSIAAGDWLPSQVETLHQTPWWTKACLDNSVTLVTTAKGYNVSNYIAECPSSE